MRLYATITSERATKGQGGNEYLIIDFTIGSAKSPQKIGQVELYYNADTENPVYQKEGINTDEWVLQYRPDEDTDWEIIAQGIIAQGNVMPKQAKVKRQKGEMICHQCGTMREYKILHGKKHCSTCGEQME